MKMLDKVCSGFECCFENAFDSCSVCPYFTRHDINGNNAEREECYQKLRKDAYAILKKLQSAREDRDEDW